VLCGCRLVSGRNRDELLDEVGGSLQAVGSGFCADVAAAFADTGVVEEGVEPGGESAGGEATGGEAGADTEAMESGGVVGLVVGEVDDELWDAGMEGLGGGADAAMVDDGGATR
jgi:hypothetical protein